eukprot:2460289-Alexandrium_andersonii.AAC.1
MAWAFRKVPKAERLQALREWRASLGRGGPGAADLAVGAAGATERAQGAGVTSSAGSTAHVGAGLPGRADGRGRSAEGTGQRGRGSPRCRC